MDSIPAEEKPNEPPLVRHHEREINSADLLQGEREVVIHHEGMVYRLSVTRAGKLILRK